MKRLTLTGGLRWDYYHSYFPAATLGPTVLTPNRNVSFAASDGVSWKDITPRMGGSYDLFGNGKTAVKASLNKYLGFTGVASGSRPFAGGLNPVSLVVNTTTRSWNDANKNFVPDCNLLLTTANGECGALANSGFGLPITNTTYDPAILNGYNLRDYNWEFTTGVQQQLGSRLSVEVNFFRRWYGNLKATDNLSVAASDFTAFSIVAPTTDSRLSTAGQTISGLYNVNPAKFGLTNNFVTMASNYGDWIQNWQGVDITTTVRAWSGVTLQGGISTGRDLRDNCAVLAALPETAQPAGGDTTFPAGSTTVPYCHIEGSYMGQTQVKGLGTYQVPKIDLRVSLAFQSVPGPVMAANYAVPNAAVVPSLGRSLSGNASSVTVNLLPPLSTYGDRLNQVDMRLSKIFRFAGRGRLAANVDLFNLFNRNPVITQNDGFSTSNVTTWQTPQAIQPGRLIKLGAQFDF
jgi:hypothetical protein